jgi:hypothetical protein
MLDVYRTDTHSGAFLFRHSYVHPNGLVGFVMTEVLDAYADASGDSTTLGERIFTVNGCLSTPTLWNDFNEACQSYLKSENFIPDPDTGKYVLHTADFRSGQRRKWWPDTLTPRDRQRIGRRVAEMIRDHTLYRFGWGVHIGDMQQLEAEFPHVFGAHYDKLPGAYASKLCFQLNSEWAKDHGYEGRVNYMFDRGDDFWGELSEWVRNARKKVPLEKHTVGDLTEGDKRDHPALQAADFVAWHARNYFSSLSRGHLAGLLSPKRGDPELEIFHIEGSSNLVLKRYADLKTELLGDMEEFLENTDFVTKWVGDGKPFANIDDVARFLIASEKEEQDARRQQLLDDWRAKKKARRGETE